MKAKLKSKWSIFLIFCMVTFFVYLFHDGEIVLVKAGEYSVSPDGQWTVHAMEVDAFDLLGGFTYYYEFCLSKKSNQQTDGSEEIIECIRVPRKQKDQEFSRRDKAEHFKWEMDLKRVVVFGYSGKDIVFSVK